ncbi:replicase [Atractylodes mottle virus]|uniref:Replicase n=1 Tax=Atractylodes mottle virus TaxID=1702121 RepID=A0A0K2BN37_9VIRU|nr:replicase [Atractylodes mottle virus]AKZ66614.1 replicase [Atractylodes mottle virus]
MSLTYRSPLEENLGAYDSTVQAAIASTSANHYREAEAANFQYFNFHLRPEAKKHLIEAGIYLSPFSAVPHSHPACKTLENHLLYNVLPKLIDNRFYFVGIKNHKLDLLKTRNSSLSTISQINRYVTSADKARYGSDLVRVSSDEHVCIARHKFELSKPTLQELVPRLQLVNHDYLFLHDELHYWSPKALITFLEVLKPKVMYATLVYPPELLAGSKYSLNKWCYTFKVFRRDLLFYPDGVMCEGYQQPLKGGYLLRANKIILNNGDVYMVDVIHSKFAHHLVSITRGELAANTVRSFGPFEATSTRGLEPLLRNVQHCFPVSYSVVSKIYRYLNTLKKPDAQSAMAKLSQLLEEPSGLEMKFLKDFANLVINTSGINTMIKPERLRMFFGKWLKELPTIISSQLSLVQTVSLDDFVTYLAPFTFEVQLGEVHYDHKEILSMFDMAECAEEMDVPDLMDRFTLGKSAMLADRVPQPVSADLFNVFRKTSTLLKVPLPIFARYLVCEITYMLDPLCRVVSLSVIREAIALRLIRGSPMILPLQQLLNLIRSGPLLRDCVNKVISHYARLLTVFWHEDWFNWCIDPNRHNLRFLTAQPDHVSTFRSITQPFRFVVDEVSNFCKSSLRKRRMPAPYCFAELAGTDRQRGSVIERKENDYGGTQEASGKHTYVGSIPISIGHVPATIPVNDTIECELPTLQIVRQVGAFSCPCSLDIPIMTMPLPDNHNFKSPDLLKGRRGGWYTKRGNVPYTYHGGKHQDLGWPRWLPDWMLCNGIDLDYYDCVLYQKYEKHGRIGLHSDDEAIFDPNGRVHTCNLSGSVEFTITCGKGFTSASLEPGTQFTMPAGMQQTHKHAVMGASAGRESLTFRKLAVKVESPPEIPTVDVRSGGEPEATHGPEVSVPEQQKEPLERAGDFDIAGGRLSIVAVDAVLEQINYRCHAVPGDGNCFWYSIEKALGFEAMQFKSKCSQVIFNQDGGAIKKLSQQMQPQAFAEDEAIMAAAICSKHCIRILCPDEKLSYTYTPKTDIIGCVHMRLSGEHFEHIEPVNKCLVTAIAAALGRSETAIMNVLEQQEQGAYQANIWAGDGIDIQDLEFYFTLFDIQAVIFVGDQTIKYNEGGHVPACFNLDDGHISFCRKNCPVNVEVLKGEASTLSVSDKSVFELATLCTQISYTASHARAKVLADSLESGCTGITLSKLFNDAHNLMPEHEQGEVTATLNCLFGTFGCGKSTLFTKFTQKNPGKGVFYVSPRKALAVEHERKCIGGQRTDVNDAAGRKKNRRPPHGKNWHTLTFEKFLKQVHLVKPRMALIIDEIQLYPPGYLDLALLLIAKGVHIFIGGDPCQSDYDNEKDRAWLGTMGSDVDRLLGDQTYKFNTCSQRFKNSNFVGRLPCALFENKNPEPQSEEAHLLFTGCDELVQLEPEYCEVFLVSSFEEKKIVETHFPNVANKAILTFGESTGLNYKKGTILITNVSSYTNERRWVTALSRFSSNVCLVNLVGVDWNGIAMAYRGRVLGRFLARTAKTLDLCELLPGKPEFVMGFQSHVGKDEGVREAKLEGDPWLKCMIDLGQTEDVEEVEDLQEVMQEEWFKTHLPQAELESVRARWVHRFLAKEKREVRMGSMVSEQFTDEYAKEGGLILTNAAERFEAIYPRHRANDTVTFIMAVKKRLRFSRPAVEQAKLNEAELYGEFLLREFCKKVPLNGMKDERMMEQAKRAFEEKKVSKSAAIIENHAGRSCRDWLLDIGQIFSKSQLCTKFDNRFRVAKAAQSIVCFQHAVLCRFAPYIRYIEAKLNEALPKNFYIHSGKGLEELQEWVIKGKFSGICTESDYEAFDASQDQYIVAFEVAVMRKLGLPESLISDYKFIKTHLGSKLGNFAIMRFSGEASTFLFNTMANMLFTFLRYDLKGREYICFAGDDMCASERLPLRHEHDGFLKKLKLKAKVFMVEKPTFCGWHLCPDGIYKKPQLVLERMLIAKEKNNLANCLDNYAIEVAYAYKLGERAVNRMDAEELEAAYNCVRIIIKNKKLLKSDILHFYSNLESKM